MAVASACSPTPMTLPEHNEGRPGPSPLGTGDGAAHSTVQSIPNWRILVLHDTQADNCRSGCALIIPTPSPPGSPTARDWGHRQLDKIPVRPRPPADFSAPLRLRSGRALKPNPDTKPLDWGSCFATFQNRDVGYPGASSNSLDRTDCLLKDHSHPPSTKVIEKNVCPADRFCRKATADSCAVRKWVIRMPSLEHLIYASVATQPFGASELTELLEKSRAANERLGLTGMLLHSDADGSFFQVLEGQGAAIDGLLQKILQDKRHSHLTMIIREPIAERSFGGWTMGFSSVSPEKLRKIPGLNDFFRKGSSFADLDAGRAKKLLTAFAEGRWRPKHLGAKGVAA